MAIFNKNINLTGIHAYILQKYVKPKGSDRDVPFFLTNHDGEKVKVDIFDTRIRCFLVAAMVGIINKKKSDLDKDPGNNASIFYEIIDKEFDNIERIYQHMIFATYDNLSYDEKVKKAFSIRNEQENNEAREEIEAYARGGLEILDSIFSKCQSYEDMCNTLFELRATLNIR